jgi:hypothetical protein
MLLRDPFLKEPLMSKPEFLELSLAVVRLGSSERTIRRRIEEGELVGKKIGRKWYVQVAVPAMGMGVQPAPGPQLSFADHAASPAGNTGSVARPQDKAVPADGRAAVPAMPALGNATDTPMPSAPLTPPVNTPPPQQQPPPYQRRAGNARDRGERRWGRGHEGHTPAPGDALDQAFAVGRLAAWKKVREMRACLKTAEDRADGDAAAAALLEGFLGFGMLKIDCYRLCRGVLCRLATRLEADDADEDHLMAVSDALGAVHALVITLSRRNSKESDNRAAH